MRHKINKTVVDELKTDFMHNRKYALAKDHYSANACDNYKSLAISIRDNLIAKWILTQQRYHHENCKRVYYLSLEFLIGKLLADNILNLGIEDECKKAMEEIGLDICELYDQEPDAGLGNGGLGRLAACFLDSMATLGIPATGYGIRYDYGIFKQKIVNGYQVEYPDSWLMFGNMWEFGRPEYMVTVRFHGRTEKFTGADGVEKTRWVGTDAVRAIAYDVPVPGYKNDVVNNLRLWSAESTEEFDLAYFNGGDYVKACEDKIFSENISRVLYPSDNLYQGKELRLKQEYFFTAASMHDIIRRFKVHNNDFKAFPEKVAIQLNDTHPAISIAELMRILVDEENIDWDTAWEITRKTFAYTNHTIMPEALESWPVSLLGKLLPRHLEIIYDINARFLKEVEKKYPGDMSKLGRMSLIEEGYEKKVRMAYLSIIGSHSVNGVSALHSELLVKNVFKDFAEMFPGLFNSKTNGITPRRWLKKANPLLSSLITERIGDGWVKDLSELKKLETLKNDDNFIHRWCTVKHHNKIRLAAYVKNEMGITIDPTSMFDVQVKRIHEYKRQSLFALYLIALYLDIKNNPSKDFVPRTAVIAGKAAPGYFMAKQTIKFINSIAGVVNSDHSIKNKLKVVFIPDYKVSVAEMIFPASDLSEQISTAGREASGTGNMKFMLNGALTIGTLDGANVEMAEEVGDDNIFIFGLKADEAIDLQHRGYSPREYVQNNETLVEIVELIRSNFFSQEEKGIFNSLLYSLLNNDEYLVFADFGSYYETQCRVSETYKDMNTWVKKSIMNTARSGKFSSDRTIGEYAKKIWNV
ncbi:MAG: glycogen/starch/alpha-glucan phosphorylase [Candidatus Omnitrophica bacterium]|nr:glycogen/starch/alpha-glucan phosphorylase [Candidatus Omnitrophota bacterium]